MQQTNGTSPPAMTWQALEERLRLWHAARYPAGVHLGNTLRKLREEVGELEVALSRGERAHAVEECADCAIVLTHMVRGLVPGGSLFAAMWDKCVVIEERLRNEQAGLSRAEAKRPDCHTSRTLNAQDEPGWFPVVVPPLPPWDGTDCEGLALAHAGRNLPNAPAGGEALPPGDALRERMLADGGPRGATTAARLRPALAAADRAMSAILALDVQLLAAAGHLPALQPALEAMHHAADGARAALEGNPTGALAERQFGDQVPARSGREEEEGGAA